MNRELRKQISYLLVIMVTLLPFASVYSISIHDMNDSNMAMHDMAMVMDCEQMDCAECQKHTDDNSCVDGKCCSDHCDATFSAQLCLSSEIIHDFSTVRIYSTHTSSPLPDPLVFSFLRPPLTIS